MPGAGHAMAMKLVLVSSDGTHQVSVPHMFQVFILQPVVARLRVRILFVGSACPFSTADTGSRLALSLER